MTPPTYNDLLAQRNWLTGEPMKYDRLPMTPQRAAYPWDFGSMDEATIIITKPEHYKFLVERIEICVAQAVAQEREECAKLAMNTGYDGQGEAIADAIRQRGKS